MTSSSKYEMQKNFVIDLLGGGGVSKYRTIFWPPGRVGIALGSVKMEAL